MNLTTGETTEIHRDDKRAGGAYLAAHQDVSGWVDADTAMVYRDTKQVARISGDGIAWLAAGRHTIGFAAGRATTSDYLLDLRTGCLHNLADTQGVADVHLEDTAIAWSVDNPEDKNRLRAWHVATIR
ncbi:MAG TPA: hypothetical protein VI076_14130 [Actinopolymorphaceae bacterium]